MIEPACQRRRAGNDRELGSWKTGVPLAELGALEVVLGRTQPIMHGASACDLRCRSTGRERIERTSQGIGEPGRSTWSSPTNALRSGSGT